MRTTGTSRRSFLLGLPMVTVGVASAQAIDRLILDGADSAPTVEELKKSVLLAAKWKEATFDKRQYLFALTFDGDGESYIDLHGWIYNRVFKEWRRILTLKTRSLATSLIFVDEQKGILSLKGTVGSDLDDVEIFRFDLRATSDDADYLR